MRAADYLHQPAFARLWAAARACFERNGGLRGSARLAALNAEEASALDARSPVRQLLLNAAAEYLGRATVEGKPIDPVARTWRAR